MAVLFTIGFLCTALAFGEDERPILQSLLIKLTLFGSGLISFRMLGKLMKANAGKRIEQSINNKQPIWK